MTAAGVRPGRSFGHDQNNERSESPNVCMMAGAGISPTDDGTEFHGADNGSPIWDENADEMKGDEGVSDEEGVEDVSELLVSDSDEENEEAQTAMPNPIAPRREQVDLHSISHLPYRN